jgi:hypothetical protein
MRQLVALLVFASVVSFVPAAAAPPGLPSTAASELDAFMAEVLARRDENWRKLQQYVLDERERALLLGPGGLRLFGLARDYTWYIRDGVFVRSPLRFDGVAVSDEERQKYEREWLAREAERARKRDEARAKKGEAPEAAAPALGEGDADALARLTREPQFVSMAYFLRFKFEPGHYAFAGREDYEGHPVYRIEYYPSRLFAGDEPEDEPDDEHRGDGKSEGDDRIERAMNKVALVTLWVEPGAKQILRYTFTNVGMDFLPGRSLVRVDDLQASMRMVQAFPGVWLPKGIDGEGRITLASGSYSVQYRTAYEDYREATVKARIR